MVHFLAPLRTCCLTLIAPALFFSAPLLHGFLLEHHMDGIKDSISLLSARPSSFMKHFPIWASLPARPQLFMNQNALGAMFLRSLFSSVFTAPAHFFICSGLKQGVRKCGVVSDSPCWLIQYITPTSSRPKTPLCTPHGHVLKEQHTASSLVGVSSVSTLEDTSSRSAIRALVGRVPFCLKAARCLAGFVIAIYLCQLAERELLLAHNASILDCTQLTLSNDVY
eukprot:5696786-Amphidinium_carterae.1